MGVRVISGLFLVLAFFSCDPEPEKILENVLESYATYEHDYKKFRSRDWVSPLIVLYRAQMDKEEYSSIISNSRYIRNDCLWKKGYNYENLRENAYPFEIYKVEWWLPVYDAVPDFVGHYNHGLQKFTTCEESREYKYAFYYSEGYCYLIIENTLAD